MTTFPKRIAPPIVLAIAGSEASGGAGAQTDLKTFHQLGVFGCTALTCIVSMDPRAGWDHRFVPVDPEVIHDQIEACASVHAAIDAVKIGMLGTAAAIDVVDAALEEYAFPDVVLDPVLICKGQEFASARAVDDALRERILPRATVGLLLIASTFAMARNDAVNRHIHPFMAFGTMTVLALVILVASIPISRGRKSLAFTRMGDILQSFCCTWSLPFALCGMGVVTLVRTGGIP